MQREPSAAGWTCGRHCIEAHTWLSRSRHAAFADVGTRLRSRFGKWEATMSWDDTGAPQPTDEPPEESEGPKVWDDTGAPQPTDEPPEESEGPKVWDESGAPQQIDQPPEQSEEPR